MMNELNYCACIVILTVVLCAISTYAHAQDMFSLLSVQDTPSFTFKGFIESNNTTSTYPHQEPRDIWKKDELRINCNVQYGKDSFHIYSDVNAYVLPNVFNENINPEFKYSDSKAFLRNGTLTSPHAEINFREAYLHYEKGITRLRAGNQIIAWGTADAFNPTSYFNPYDLREFLFKDEDTELRMGVPAISALFTVGNDSLEFVLTPLHVPSRLPVSQTFWQLNVKEGPFPVTIGNPSPLSIEYTHIGAGVKYYRNVAGYDIHISAYHGPDKEPYLQPTKTLLEPNKPVSILVVPTYAVSDMFGLATSKSFDKFVVQFEGAYSPNKTGVVEADLHALTPQELSTLLPYKTRKSHYVSYSAGFNYFIPVRDYLKDHEGECVFTFEWSNSHYFDDALAKPMLSDIIAVQLRDSYINNKLKVKVSGIIERQTKSYSIIPKASYRFDNGIYVELSYLYITMDKSSYYACYNDNDSVVWRVRYEF